MENIHWTFLVSTSFEKIPFELFLNMIMSYMDRTFLQY